VLGIILSKGAEPQLHKWFRESPNADLRYDIKLQNAWIEIIRREGVRSVAMLEEINGCPHEEGQDYPLGEVCPACPFWAHRRRPLEPPATVLTAIATYRQDQMGNATRRRCGPGHNGRNLGRMELLTHGI
jgi:hypothetical protein